MSNGSKFLTVLVIGKEPEKLMERYSKALKVKPYVKYKYLDAEKMKDNAIKMLTEITNTPEKLTLNKFQVDYFKERLKAISSMSSFEYYRTITDGLYYDENGDALSEENPDGKWDTYALGKNFSYPFKLTDGKESYQARVGEIDWNRMHMDPDVVKLFETIWALVVDDDDPSNDDEEKLKKNWATKKNYLSNFKSVDDFVSHNCAYWNYAVLSDKGWVDVDDDGNESSWINNFFERFITPLEDGELLTIYEYSISN
jgi:hypothetical protein